MGVGSRGVAAAAGGVDDGVGAVTGVDAGLGAADSDVRIIVEARSFCRVVAGGVGRVLVDVEALEDGVDAKPPRTEVVAPVKTFADVSGATNEPPDRNALTNCGLAVAKLVRGWAIAASFASG